MSMLQLSLNVVLITSLKSPCSLSTERMMLNIADEVMH